MNSKVLIIVGMHRSGTSVVSQWLRRSGLFIGNTLLGPDTGNDQGHFEDADFLYLHQKLLLKRKLPDDGFICKVPAALSEPEKTELREMVEYKSKRHQQWGWKEPRTCLFLNEYDQLMPSAFYVIVVRSFNDTVNSMIRRAYKVSEKKFMTKKGLSKLKWILFKRKTLEQMYERNAEKFLKVWIHYYEQILKHAESLPDNRFLVLNYTGLVWDDAKVIAKIRDQWNFAVDFSPFVNVYKLPEMVQPVEVKKYIKNRELEARARSIEKDIYDRYSVSI